MVDPADRNWRPPSAAFWRGFLCGILLIAVTAMFLVSAGVLHV